MIYFGYCTLLDTNEMKKYCPTAKPSGVASLFDYRLCFGAYHDNAGGGCNLEEAAGNEMLGLLYEVTPEELAGLDAISGVDKGYYEQSDVEVVKDGAKIPVVTYVIPKLGGPFQPAATYTRPILVGARALQLPQEYIAQLEEIIQAAQQPDE